MPSKTSLVPVTACDICIPQTENHVDFIADDVAWKQDAISHMIWQQLIYMSVRIVEVAGTTEYKTDGCKRLRAEAKKYR